VEKTSLKANLAIRFRPDTPARARFDYWIAVERCLPGTLRLVAMYGTGGRIVDLVCTTATPSTPRLLSDNRIEPVGKRLSTLLSQHADADDLLHAYIMVIKTGEPARCHATRDSGEHLQHRISLDEPGIVRSELRSQSAFERAKATYVLLKTSA
jgi:hypothetical protein